MLTKGDEYPIHQTPEPIAFAGTDRNFYDRYFFCAYLPDGSGYCAAAFGVYPHLNIADAHFSVVRDGVQHCIHASRVLGFERMDLSVGPIRIEVVEPLKSVRLVIDDYEGIAGDLLFDSRSAPCQEPRFTRRNGTRLFMDLTRFTVNAHVSGWVSVEGRRTEYVGALGTRDRSWGIRQIGAADAQPQLPPSAPQFYWLWAPTNFPNLSLFAHVNEDASGAPWNHKAALMMDGAEQDGVLHLGDDRFTVDWQSGTRRAQAITLDVQDPGGRAHQVQWTPIDVFLMKGIGYLHPHWGHGMYKGELVVEREDLYPNAGDHLSFDHLHIQHIAAAQHVADGLAAAGIGIVEQLVLGPHAPSGFATLNDGAL